MKSVLKAAVLLTTLLALTACSKSASSGPSAPPAPTAAFGFSPTAPLTGQLVAFTDQSTGAPTGWAWNFGDGGTSTTQNPTHAYAAAGTFTAQLTASNAGGSSARSAVVIVRAASNPPSR